MKTNVNWMDALILAVAAVVVGLVATGCEGLGKDVEGVSYLGPASPPNFEASSGEHVNEVELRWDAVPEAREYRLYRDGEQIYQGTATSYTDESADAPTVGPPRDLEAESEDPSMIQLHWSGTEREDGTSHQYRVVSLGEDGLEGRASEDAGYRGPPDIDAYQIAINGDATDIVDGEQTSYIDDELPPHHVELATDDLAATEGDHHSEVRLMIPESGTEVTDGVLQDIPITGASQVYTVEPVPLQEGDFLVESAEVTATPMDYPLTPPQIEWQRFESADAQQPESWSAEHDDGVWVDSQIPPENSPRYYRAVIDVDVLEQPWESDIVFGYAACDPDAQGDYGGGAGDEQVPLMLCSAEHLETLAEGVNTGSLDDDAEYFALADDIDLQQITPWEPIGTEDDPFDRHFHGAQHAIDNLVVHRPDGDAGLFGHLEGATVQQLRLSEVDVEGQHAGALAATTAAGSDISGIGADGSVAAGQSGGGLIAQLTDSTLQRAYSGVNVELAVTGGEAGGVVGSVTEGTLHEIGARGHVVLRGNQAAGTAQLGGIAGHLHQVELTDAYATGSIYAPFPGAVDAAGGVGGVNLDPVDVARVFAYGAVHGPYDEEQDDFDFVFGRQQAGIDNPYIFYNQDSRCYGEPCDGEDHQGLSTEAFRDEDEFTGTDGFEFGDYADTGAVWTDVGHGPPRLQWTTRSGWNLIGQCDGSVDVNDSLSDRFAGGDGQYGSPWVICSRQQLELIDELIEQAGDTFDDYLQLGGDIHLGAGEWEPLATDDSTQLDVTFDGAGHRIGHLTSAEPLADSDQGRGLFDSLGSSAVHQLELTDVQLHPHGEDGPTGALAADARADVQQMVVTGVLDLDTVDNVADDDDSLAQIGGLVGHLHGGGGEDIRSLLIASIRTPAPLFPVMPEPAEIWQLGGVVGSTDNEVELTGINSTIDARFRDTYGHAELWAIGGVVGEVAQADVDEGVTIIEGCHVEADLSFESANSAIAIGGVVGHGATEAVFTNQNGDPLTVERCHVGEDGQPWDSHIGGTDSVGAIAGGLAGRMELRELSATAEVHGEDRLGGLVGELTADTTLSGDAVVLADSYFQGEVLPPDEPSTGATAAGVVGMLRCLNRFVDEDLDTIDECGGLVKTIYSSAPALDRNFDGDPLIWLADGSQTTDGIDDWRDPADNHWITDNNYGTADPRWGNALPVDLQDDETCYGIDGPGDSADCTGPYQWEFGPDETWSVYDGIPAQLNWHTDRELWPVHWPVGLPTP